MKIDLTHDGNRVVATVVGDGLPGMIVSRTGRNEREATAEALRALARLLDGMPARGNVAASSGEWIRMNIEVDVRVPSADLLRVEAVEDAAMSGSRQAAEELMQMSLRWLDAAVHDHEARSWRQFSWGLVEDCEEDGSLGMA